MEAGNKGIDMTKGSPVNVVLRFAFPIILGNLLQQFYALADAVIVGRFVDLNALAAIGGTDWVRWALLGVCTDCSMGFGIVASKRVGAGDWKGLKETAAAGIQFVAVMGTVLTSLSWALLDVMLMLLRIPDNIYGDAKLYLWFSVIAIPISLIFNMACAFLRAFGDSKGPFAAVILSAAMNIGLDLWFIISFRWGVFGAAFATFLSQLFSMLYVLVLIAGRKAFRITRENFRWNPDILKETAKLWIPLLFNSVAISAGGVIVQRYINACGAIVAAGVDAGVKIYGLLETVEKAVCSAISVFVGQNLGANMLGRIRKGMNSMTVFAFVFSGWLALMLLVFGDFFIGLFLNENQNPQDLKEAYHAARIYLNIQCISVFLMTPMHFYRGAIQALGHAVYPLIAAFLQIFARWATVALLAPVLGLVGMCLPDGTAALASLPLVVIPYFIYMKKLEAKKR